MGLFCNIPLQLGHFSIFSRLKCKSNWLTIPNIDIYDQVDFVCPTLKLNVDLLDSYTRPKSELNVNIFRRKVDENMNMTQLREKLNDGTFCDPTKSVKLKTCNNGVEGQSLTVIFKNQNGYKTNDTFVFFCKYDMLLDLFGFFHPFLSRPAKTMPFTLSNTRRFYSSRESLWVGKG